MTQAVHMTPHHKKVKLITDNSGYVFGERLVHSVVVLDAFPAWAYEQVNVTDKQT